TPTGVRPTAQGCRTRLPWEIRIAMGPNPNGVAAAFGRMNNEMRWGLCTRDPDRNPFGVGRSRDYPGLPYSATLGKPDRDGAQPQRGCGCVWKDEQRNALGVVHARPGPQPLWGWQISRLPRVAEYGNPGLRDATTSWLKKGSTSW